MKYRTYNLIERAVEQGLEFGAMRTDKHAKKPLTPEQKALLVKEARIAIMSEICEIFSFDDEYPPDDPD